MMRTQVELTKNQIQKKSRLNKNTKKNTKKNKKDNTNKIITISWNLYQMMNKLKIK